MYFGCCRTLHEQRLGSRLLTIFFEKVPRQELPDRHKGPGCKNNPSKVRRREGGRSVDDDELGALEPARVGIVQERRHAAVFLQPLFLMESRTC